MGNRKSKVLRGGWAIVDARGKVKRVYLGKGSPETWTSNWMTRRNVVWDARDGFYGKHHVVRLLVEVSDAS